MECVTWQRPKMPTLFVRNFSTVPIHFIRRKSTFHKVSQWYREFWNPQPHPPPYGHICQIGDPVLRRKAELVNLSEIRTDRIRDLLLKMRAVMRHYKSVGLAAPQVGVPLQIFMIEFPESLKEKFTREVYQSREMSVIPLSVFINPEMEITNYQKVAFPEACESVKGLSAVVSRFRAVRIRGYDWDGEPAELEATGWPARIIQHEMDHLNGRMYTDLMDCQTLQVDCWHKINARCGKYELPYYKSN